MSSVSSLASLPSSTPQNAEFAHTVAGLGRQAPLPYALEARLALAPGVWSFSPDPQSVRLAHSLDLAQAGLVFRSVRLINGRGVNVVAVPSVCWRDPIVHASVLDLKWVAQTRRQRLVLVPESVIRVEPRLTNALLVSACDGVHVTPRERLILLSHLAEVGGSASLEVCAEALAGSGDPAGAVLRLVAERVLTIALDRPIDLQSEVSLAAWR